MENETATTTETKEVYKRPLYEVLANLMQAIVNSRKGAFPLWLRRHTARIESLCKNHLPHGSGFDVGVKIDIERSTSEKLVLYFSFHHMDENGFYCGWTDHEVIVKPSLMGQFTLRITGRDDKYRQFKDMVHERFDYALKEYVPLYGEPPKPRCTTCDGEGNLEDTEGRVYACHACDGKGNPD